MAVSSTRAGKVGEGIGGGLGGGGWKVCPESSTFRVTTVLKGVLGEASSCVPDVRNSEDFLFTKGWLELSVRKQTVLQGLFEALSAVQTQPSFPRWPETTLQTAFCSLLLSPSPSPSVSYSLALGFPQILCCASPNWGHIPLKLPRLLSRSRAEAGDQSSRHKRNWGYPHICMANALPDSQEHRFCS